MNKIMTRLLMWSIFLMSYSFIYAQEDINTIKTESSKILICTGSTWINKPLTESYPYTYQYWNGSSWVCCFGGNQSPYEFSVPQTGQLIEVQRKYTNGQTVVKTESMGLYYSPVAPTINHVAYPSACNGKHWLDKGQRFVC